MGDRTGAGLVGSSGGENLETAGNGNVGAGKIGVLIGLQIAIFLSAIDQTVLNVAIPKIATLLNDFDRGAWLITSYLLFATVTTPVAGKLSDIYGVKPILIVVTLLFGVTSALCGVAGLIDPIFSLRAMDQLIFFRALQGIAGGAMIGLSFVAVGELFSARERGKYQGLLAAAFILAAIIGPVVGGWLVETQSWRYIFYINIPPVVVAAIVFTYTYPKSSRAKAEALIDYPGIVLFILCIAPLLLASSEIGKTGSVNSTSAIEGTISLISLVAFLIREKTAAEPLIPLQIFRDRIISISLFTVFVTGIGLFGSMLLIAMMLQTVLGVSATESGALLTPLMLVVAGASVAGGIAIAKTGKYKLLILGSLVLMEIGTILLGTVNKTTSPAFLLGCAAAGGVGLGLLLPIHSIIIQNFVKGNLMGVATSMSQFFRSLGGTLGTGLMSALMLTLMKQGSLEQAIQAVLSLYAIALAAAIVANFFLPEIELRSKEPKSASA